jgi:hypothetical protein
MASFSYPHASTEAHAPREGIAAPEVGFHEEIIQEDAKAGSQPPRKAGTKASPNQMRDAPASACTKRPPPGPCERISRGEGGGCGEFEGVHGGKGGGEEGVPPEGEGAGWKGEGQRVVGGEAHAQGIAGGSLHDHFEACPQGERAPAGRGYGAVRDEGGIFLREVLEVAFFRGVFRVRGVSGVFRLPGLGIRNTMGGLAVRGRAQLLAGQTVRLDDHDRTVSGKAGAGCFLGRESGDHERQEKES